MTFEFLIVYTRGADILSEVRDCLGKVLEYHLGWFDEQSVERMIIPRLERRERTSTPETGGIHGSILFGFALELPDDPDLSRAVIKKFVETLGNSDSVTHLLKFEDPLLYEDLARWGTEIAALEIKLRRVLSIIYLHAYRDGNPYDLLCEEIVKPINKELPKPDDMKRAAENQFFYLTLNQRPELKLAEF
jgi:hypothetical protein